MADRRPLTTAERQRRSYALREQGGLVAPVRLNKDQLDTLDAATEARRTMKHMDKTYR